MDQDKLDSAQREIATYEAKLKQKQHELEENKNRVSKLEDYITSVNIIID